MALVECANGHLYNTDQYASCPYCGGTMNRVEIGYGGDSSIGKTAPAGFGATAAPSGYGATAAPSGYGYGGGGYAPGPEYGATVAPASYGYGAPGGFGGGEDIGATVAPSSYTDSQKQETSDEDTGKTVAVLKKSLNVDPVAGWIVCIEGTDKGKDFRILAKNNSIGRSEKMDICIKGDTTISRENHAKIAYDVKHNTFHLIPADSTNSIYLNGEPVYVPTVLEANDVLEFGESKFMFVPFCSEKFTWQS